MTIMPMALSWIVAMPQFKVKVMKSKWKDGSENSRTKKLATLGQAVANSGYGISALIFTIIASLGFIAIGVLLVEYMNDGTINNKAFNIICIVTVLSIIAAMIINIIGMTTGNPSVVVLIIFYNLYRLAMVFMATFFAYDSAKHQLKKNNLTK